MAVYGCSVRLKPVVSQLFYMRMERSHEITGKSIRYELALISGTRHNVDQRDENHDNQETKRKEKCRFYK